MSIVRTILGDIDPKLMGVTDAHEHLIRIGGGEVAHGGEDMRLPSVEKAVEETRMFLAAGGKTIVDTAPVQPGPRHPQAAGGQRPGRCPHHRQHRLPGRDAVRQRRALGRPVHGRADRRAAGRGHRRGHRHPRLHGTHRRAQHGPGGRDQGRHGLRHDQPVRSEDHPRGRPGSAGHRRGAQHAHPRRHDGLGAGPTADALRRPARAHHAGPRAAQPGSVVPQADRGPGRQLHV